jgi:Mg/Co/Ni transporter MgtE
VGSDGRLYCGTATNGANSDIWLYSSSGTLLNQFKLSTTGKQLAARQMAVAGDGLTLIAITIWSAIVSSIIPMLLKKMRIDPAVVSAPFIATFIDGTGLVIYFNIAMLVISDLA